MRGFRPLHQMFLFVKRVYEHTPGFEYFLDKVVSCCELLQSIPMHIHRQYYFVYNSRLKAHRGWIGGVWVPLCETDVTERSFLP